MKFNFLSLLTDLVISLAKANSPEFKITEAVGDYYFDLNLGRTERAFGLRIPGREKPVPYHYKVNTGEAPKSSPAILVWASSESKELAYEDEALEYARAGAILDLIDYGQHLGINFLEEVD